MSYTFNGFVVPDYTMEAIRRYVDNGIPTGGFLEAVIRNDLRDAVGRADMSNMAALPAIVGYFYNECPALCWGTLDKYEKWIAKGGLNRRKEASNETE